MVLFSGDFVGPSLMSSLTQGAHIIAALNAVGVGRLTQGSPYIHYSIPYIHSYIHKILTYRFNTLGTYIHKYIQTYIPYMHIQVYISPQYPVQYGYF